MNSTGWSGSGDAEGPCTIVSGLFAFVMGLVVVGAALVVAIGVGLIGPRRRTKPATPEGEADLGTASAEGQMEATDISRWHRVRSGVLLVTLLTALGIAAALVLLVAGVIIVTGLKTAVQ